MLVLAGGAAAAAEDLGEAARLLEAGRPGEAWAALERSPDADSAEGRLLASRIFEERGDLPGAAAAAEAALERDADHEAARLQLGRLFLTGNNPQAALEIFAAGLERAPGNRLLQLGEALALKQLRRYEEALERFEALLEATPGMGLALDGFVEAALELQRYDAARDAARRGIEATPDDYRGYYLLALVEDRDRAAPAEERETWLRQSLERAPRFAPAYTLLGKALLELERPEEAALMLETALRLDPGDRLALIQLARAYRILGRPEDARREAEKLRELGDADPADAAVLRRRSETEAPDEPQR